MLYAQSLGLGTVWLGGTMNRDAFERAMNLGEDEMMPWRVVVAGNTVHFYLKRSNGVGHGSKLDMQMIDMGIALCHFALTAKENGMTIEFIRNNPNFPTSFEVEYIGSYVCK